MIISRATYYRRRKTHELEFMVPKKVEGEYYNTIMDRSKGDEILLVKMSRREAEKEHQYRRDRFRRYGY